MTSRFERRWVTSLADDISLNYVVRPSVLDARLFLRECVTNQHLPLVYDIETAGSAGTDEDERAPLYTSEGITQIQFSLRVGEGIVFPWQGDYIDAAKDILALAHTKYSFYGHLFDDPRLLAAGCVFGGPYPHDLYEMWHHMQPDLPANLQFVTSFYAPTMPPWKHLAGEDLSFYGCCDVDAPQRILAKLPDQLKRRGIWNGYERYVYALRPVLARMEQRGIPVNDERRRAFGLELDAAAAETDADMQRLVPDALKNVHPKDGYKRTPKDTTGMVLRAFAIEEPSDDGQPVAHVERYCRIEPFKPSSQQLIRYMKHAGHHVPRNIKEDRDTTVAVELERLARRTHDPLYRKVIWYREVRLMKSTFVDGWAPAADGRVHTTFTFAPATGQLSSRDPNVQNSPEHEKEGHPDINLADKFQRIMETPDGYRFVSFDHKSFHALTQAHLAGDKVYERIARIDMHSFLGSEFLRQKPASAMLAMRDDELADYLGWFKSKHRFVRDFKCKRVILGWQFGRGYKSIYNAYLESFENETEAKRLVQTLESCFPVTVKWRKAIMSKAHYDTFLLSPFGFIRWFWDVMHFDPRTGGLRNGDQAEQAIAFLPANCAFGMMRDEALTISERGLDERYGLVNNVHDAWKCCVEDKLVEECIHTIKPLMEAPSAVMGGLWCAVSVSVGKNMGAKSDDNPDGREEVAVHDSASKQEVPA